MPVDVSQVSQLEQQLEGKTKELSTLKARISELENELKTVEGLKTQLVDKTQELSTSEGRVSELEKKLKEVQAANVKTVQGLKNQLDQKTKEMSTSKGRISDVEKGLNEALAASQANIKIAEEARTASQKLEDKVKDLISQVSGLKSALAVVDQEDEDTGSYDVDGDIGMDLDPVEDEADDTLSLPIAKGTYKEKAPEQAPEQSYQVVPNMLPNIVPMWIWTEMEG